MQKNELRSQGIPGFFWDDGDRYVITANLIRNGDRYGKRIGGKIISHWENVETEDEFDFRTAKKIVLSGVIA